MKGIIVIVIVMKGAIFIVIVMEGVIVMVIAMIISTLTLKIIVVPVVIILMC